jgi:crotonobetainyl-CoA:carnitine CoA-transferase CaiB-like acyl-CoA transferase
VFRTRDGWILCQVIGNSMFARWATLVGADAWRTDARFRNDSSRGENGATISERMAAWCADRTTAEALSALEQAAIPGAAVLTPQQVLDDPQVQATGVLDPVDYPGLSSPAPVARIPVWLSATAPVARGRAPLVGEHTDAILAQLGDGCDRRAAAQGRSVSHSVYCVSDLERCDQWRANPPGFVNRRNKNCAFSMRW